jgi:hypothetical protein
MGGHKIPFDFGEQVIGGRELISHTGSMALRRGQATLPPLCSGRYPKQNSYDLKIQGGGEEVCESGLGLKVNGGANPHNMPMEKP